MAQEVTEVAARWTFVEVEARQEASTAVVADEVTPLHFAVSSE